MLSACLNGQTGPHRDYPGFGGQGAALAGLQLPHRLARPRADRPLRHHHRLAGAALRRGGAGRRAAPPAPHRTGLPPRPVAGRGRRLGARPLAAALRRHRADHRAARQPARVGRAPRRVPLRRRRPLDRHRRAGPTTSGRALAEVLGLDGADLRRRSPAAADRRADEVEALVAAATVGPRGARPGRTAPGGRRRGGARAGLRRLRRRPPARPPRPLPGRSPTPASATGHYERNGFRLSADDGGYDRPSPLLGEHTRTVLAERLGLTDTELDALAADGVLT